MSKKIRDSKIFKLKEDDHYDCCHLCANDGDLVGISTSLDNSFFLVCRSCLKVLNEVIEEL